MTGFVGTRKFFNQPRSHKSAERGGEEEEEEEEEGDD